MKLTSLKNGTRVVSKLDGECGVVVAICTFSRSGCKVWSYTVKTSSGREVWHAQDLIVL